MAAPSSIDQLKDWLNSYTLSQKVAIIGSAASVIVLLWTLVYFVNRVDYQVLYSELDPSDAQAVVQRLQGMSVEYRLSDDGATVRVPRDKMSEIRIQLASEGLPESGRIGFEIFDRTNFGLTNFQEQVNFQRALEGELARSISTLSEVDVARVHLVLSGESLFKSDENQTKASVILRLSRGRSLADSSVNGIVHMVASSVKGLEPAKVTVIDFAGRILSKNDDSGPMSGRQLETRLTIESELAEKITRILEPVVGVGKVRPQVSVVMDWQQVEETVEQYDPNASVIRSQQIRTERTPGDNPAIGIPGPQGQADPAAVPAQPGEGDYVSENEVVNYEVSKSVRHVVNPVGEILSMSVAVILDNKTTIEVDDEGVATPLSEPWPQQEMTKYRDLVAATVGFNANRGDSLIVENVSFGNEALPVIPPTMLEQQAPLILTALRYLIIPIVFLFVYLLFLRPLQKTIFANWEPRPQLAAAAAAAGDFGATIQTPVSVQQLEEQLNSAPLPTVPGQAQALPAQVGMPAPANPAPAGIDPNSIPSIASARGPNTVPAIASAATDGSPEREFLPLPTSNKVDLIRSRVVEHAKREPETVARLVRVWLNEEKQ